MHAVLLAILFLAPREAPRPAVVVPVVRVDIIVVNRHRQVREWDERNWRHDLIRKREFTETWWVSFWDLMVVSVPPFGPVAVDLIDRGWWPANEIEVVAPAHHGFAVVKKGSEKKPGLTVIGSELWIIDSPFDWEVRNRRLYRPMRSR